MVLEGLGERLPVKPSLRVVGTTPFQEAPEDTVRECRIKRIKWLAKAYRLQWLVDQHCFGLMRVDHLDSEALKRLHGDMEFARECRVEGTGFDEAGLVRIQS